MLWLREIRERFNEVDEYAPIGRERVLHRTASVSLFDQPCENEPARVLPYSLLISSHRLNDVFKCDLGTLCDKQKYLDSPMVGHTLEMPLKLARALYLPFFHIYILSHP